MRIAGGEYRGRKLEAPKNNDIRPTSDKVRQAVFNMLNSRGLVVDAVVIDAFCGTGALGLEALSQGANRAVFFDKNKVSYNLARDNIHALGVESKSHIFCQDVTSCNVKPDNIDRADLVFLDPPYHKDLISVTIKNLDDKDWLAQDVNFLMEMRRDEEVSSPIIKIIHEKIYGDTKILLGQLS